MGVYGAPSTHSREGVGVGHKMRREEKKGKRRKKGEKEKGREKNWKKEEKERKRKKPAFEFDSIASIVKADRQNVGGRYARTKNLTYVLLIS